MSDGSYKLKIRLTPRNIKTPRSPGSKVIDLKEARMYMIANKIWKYVNLSGKIGRRIESKLNEVERNHPPAVAKDPVKKGLDTAQWVARVRIGETSLHGYYTDLSIKLVNEQKPFRYTITVDNKRGHKVYVGYVANQAAVRLADRKQMYIKGKRYLYRITPINMAKMSTMYKEPRRRYMVLRFYSPGIPSPETGFKNAGHVVYRYKAVYKHSGNKWYRNMIKDTCLVCAKSAIKDATKEYNK